MCQGPAADSPLSSVLLAAGADGAWSDCWVPVLSEKPTFCFLAGQEVQDVRQHRVCLQNRPRPRGSVPVRQGGGRGGSVGPPGRWESSPVLLLPSVCQCLTLHRGLHVGEQLMSCSSQLSEGRYFSIESLYQKMVIMNDAYLGRRAEGGEQACGSQLRLGKGSGGSGSSREHQAPPGEKRRQ